MYSEIENLAKLVVEHSVEVKKGEKVLIEGDPTGTSLLHLYLHKEILKQGGIPIHKLIPGDCDYLNLVYGDEFQFQAMAEDDKKTIETIDILIGMQASTNPRRADTVDPEKIMMYNKATRIVREVVFRKLNEGKLRMFFVEYPINGIAQEHGMSLVEYEDHFCKACFLDEKDPLGEWKKLSKKQDRFIKFLDGKKTIHVEGENTNLTFSVEAKEEKKWISDNGKRYLPDGEVFTNHIVKDSVNGSVVFTYPGILERSEIKDIKLEFKEGKLVTVKSSTEEKLLHDMLLSNEGEVFMSAFGIGTNYKINKFIGHMAFDEKIGGTIHIALRGSPMWSMWVLLTRMEKNDNIYADNELFYERGDFLI